MITTLAKTIIHQDLAALQDYLTNGHYELNALDEYGYTPLIQTAIMNDTDKCRAVLAKKPDIAFTDVTGRTALHWAAENNNVEMCELLLQHGADANATTLAAQPVLTMPYLRSQFRLKQLLYQHGASLTFAQDFINAKLLGHRFELEGRVDIINHEGAFTEVDFEGFYIEFSLELLINSLKDYTNNFQGKAHRHIFDVFYLLIERLSDAHQLARMQHYLIDKQEYADTINALLKKTPLILPIAYTGHAISFIVYHNWLIRCDRGQYGRDNGSIILYKINKTDKLDTQLYHYLLYKQQTRESIDTNLVNYLELKKLFVIPIDTQVSGNCSWANMEALLPAFIFIALVKANTTINFDKCAEEALSIYHSWAQWDKNRALHFCVDDAMRLDPARKASRASILAAILFQRCNFDEMKDFGVADKITQILALPEYKYIIDAYLSAFNRFKGYDQLFQFEKFLDDAGINHTE